MKRKNTTEKNSKTLGRKFEQVPCKKYDENL